MQCQKRCIAPDQCNVDVTVLRSADLRIVDAEALRATVLCKVDRAALRAVDLHNVDRAPLRAAAKRRRTAIQNF